MFYFFFVVFITKQFRVLLINKNLIHENCEIILSYNKRKKNKAFKCHTTYNRFIFSKFYFHYYCNNDVCTAFVIHYLAPTLKYVFFVKCLKENY